MANKKIPKKVKEEIREYIKILKQDKLPIKKIILFGSFAYGKQKKWSDIDLCIVSSKFKNTYDSMQYLLSKTKTKPRYIIEPIRFTPNDFKNDYNPLVYEIKKHSIEI